VTGWRAHLIMLAFVVTAIVGLTASDVVAMAKQWWSISTYQHCVFVIPIITWLVWQRRDEVALVTPAPWWPGLGVLVLAALVWLVGDAAGVSLLRHVGVVAMIQASVLVIMGPATTRALLFPLFYLVFLVPFGDELLPPLQTVTARMAVALLDAAGVPAQLDGVFITTRDGWFEVAEACAGVKFLIAMVAYGALAANVAYRGWHRRVAFLALCIVVPVLANGVRAFGTIYAAHLTDVRTATGFDHIVYGWFFFAIVMASIIAIGWSFFDRKLGSPWLSCPIAPVGARGGLLALATATVAIVAVPVAWAARADRDLSSTMQRAIALPVLAGWALVANDVGHPWVPRFDGAAHRLYGRYRQGDRTVDIAIALYANQGAHGRLASYGQGAADATHDWKWSSDAEPVADGRAIRILAPGQVAREAITFYVLGGMTTGDTMTVKRATMLAKLGGGDQRAGVVIVSAEERPGAPAHAALDAFLRAFGRPADRVAAMLALAEAR